MPSQEHDKCGKKIEEEEKDELETLVDKTIVGDKGEYIMSSSGCS